jgi:hypothetical protein
MVRRLHRAIFNLIPTDHPPPSRTGRNERRWIERDENRSPVGKKAQSMNQKKMQFIMNHCNLKSPLKLAPDCHGSLHLVICHEVIPSVREGLGIHIGFGLPFNL